MDIDTFIDWEINKEELKSYSLAEFDKEDGSVYGFMVLKLGKYRLGNLSNDLESAKGDEDISFYVDELIRCGIAILKGEEYCIRLLNSNLLEVRVAWKTDVEGVVIEIWDTSTDKTEWKYIIRKLDLIHEVRRVYDKYIEDVKAINESILKSKSFAKTAENYKSFLKHLYLNNGRGETG